MLARSLLFAFILLFSFPGQAEDAVRDTANEPANELAEVQLTSFFQPKTPEDISKMIVLDGELATSLLVEEAVN